MFFANTLGPSPERLTPLGLFRLLKAELGGRTSVDTGELHAAVAAVLRANGLDLSPQTAIEIIATTGKLTFAQDSAQVAA